MKKISCSCTWGRGNINHNFNQYSRSRQEHIQSNKIKDNIILKETSNKTIEKDFNKIFENDVKEYNEKQTRNDRKILSYYQKVLNDKKIKAPFREVIYQIGNKKDAENPEIKDKMIKTLKKFYEEFEQNYPKLKIIGAVIHLDEATPHLHLDVIPYADGGKKGMKHKVSFEKAIEQMGFVAEESLINVDKKKPLIFNGFRNHSMRLLENLMNNEDMEREVKYNIDKHLEVSVYKEKMAIEDLKKDPEIIEKAKQEILSKMENKDKLKESLQFLEQQKRKKEQEILKLQMQYKNEKKKLSEDLEREKKSNFQKINKLQKEVADSLSKKPSFINKVIERITKSRFIATLAFFKVQYNKNIPIPEILKDLKFFKNIFDFYDSEPEKAFEEQDLFEKTYNITIYDHGDDILLDSTEDNLKDIKSDLEL